MKTNGATLSLGVILAATAGFTDAAGFRHLGGSFVSFMSGNSTRTAVAVATGDGTAALAGAGLIAGFVAGAMLGAVVDRLAGPARARPAVLAVEALLLTLAATLHALGADRAAIGAVLLAMGTENAVFVRNGQVSVGLTYVTGALVKIGQGLAGTLFGAPVRVWLTDALVWLGLVAGALAGAAAYGVGGLACLWGPAAVAALCAAWTALDPRVRRPPPG